MLDALQSQADHLVYEAHKDMPLIRRSTLPPLPRATRAALESQAAPVVDDVGFRSGLFAVSLLLLLGGAVMTFYGAQGDETQLGLGIFCLALVTASVFASRGWQDRALDGVRRLLADAPIIVLAGVLMATTAYSLYLLALLAFIFFRENWMFTPAIFAAVAVLVYLMRIGKVFDLRLVTFVGTRKTLGIHRLTDHRNPFDRRI